VQAGQALSSPVQSNRSLSDVSEAHSETTQRASGGGQRPQQTLRQVWVAARDEHHKLRAEKKQLLQEAKILDKKSSAIKASGFRKSVDPAALKKAGDAYLNKLDELEAKKSEQKAAKSELKQINQALWQGRREAVQTSAKHAGQAVKDGAKNTGNAVVTGAKMVGGGVAMAAVAVGAGAVYAGKKTAAGVTNVGNKMAEGARTTGTAIKGGAKAAGKAIHAGAAVTLTKIRSAGVSTGRAMASGAKQVGNGMRATGEAINNQRPKVQVRKVEAKLANQMDARFHALEQRFAQENDALRNENAKLKAMLAGQSAEKQPMLRRVSF
jgi:hypothetical protein